MSQSVPTARPLKYRHLADELRAQITGGTLRPGDRLPGFAQLRKHFGATQSTTHKAFELLAEEGLIVREAGRGIFVAARPKRKLASGRRTGIIGVSGTGFNFDEYAAYWSQVLRGIRQRAAESDIQVLLLDHASRSGWEKADGVLVCDWSAHDILERIPATQPRVSVLVDLPETSTVTADDYQGGRLSAQHLLDLGHERIAFLHGSDVSVMPTRVSGYRDALADAGIIPDGRWARLMTGLYHNNSEFEVAAQAAITRWLDADWDKFGFTALLCQNDATAMGARAALLQRGRLVPEDVSVVGFDGADPVSQIPGGLSTIEVPLVEIGALSADVLLRQIASDGAHELEHHVLPVRMRTGNTTMRPGIGATAAAS